ncbi:nucleoside-diphosphate sugar epimerase/dehydratase [Syntrophobotulus glycolicus]
MFFDAILINLALFGSFYLRLAIEENSSVSTDYYSTYIDAAVFATIAILAAFHFFGLYKTIWRYASVGELLSITYAVTVGVGITFVIVFFQAPQRMPYTVSLLFWLTTIFLVGGARFTQRLRQENSKHSSGPEQPKRILIIGAGDAGVLALRELKNREFQEGYPIGFIDDSRRKISLQLQGFPVLGSREEIPEVVRKYKVDEIIIAIPSASGETIRELVEICKGTKATLKILPGVYDIIGGKLNVSAIRNVQVEDLLGRDPVSVDLEEVAGYLKGQVILVTGAGGSIGSELCRQILRFGPEKLILAGRGENSIFEIEQELKKYPVSAEILDIKDAEKVRRIFQKYKPAVVFHAAAHKHVPLMENNPEEALRNNIYGTHNLAQAAAETGVKTFVLISTDKAVNPTSIMGASKRIAEMVIQDYDKRSETKFVAVRFGNVLGSRGSVIPTFKKQILAGGPVTVTDERMTRYFMTIPEAGQLVIQAGAMASGGEIFILDMGKPVKIIDLARDLIKLSGLEVDKDIKIVTTGTRPGEKLFEELLTDEEGTTATKNKRIFVARPNNISSGQINEVVTEISERGNLLQKEETEALIRNLVPDFRKNELEK